MLLFISVFYAVCVLTAQSRVVMIQDTPITSEGLSLRISLKEGDSTGNKIALIKLILEDKVPTTEPIPKEQTPQLLSETIPDMEGRFGFKDGKCPMDWVRIGTICKPK